MLLCAQMASLTEMRRAASAQCEASENAAGIDRKRLEAEALARVEAAKNAASAEREVALAAAAVRQDSASNPIIELSFRCPPATRLRATVVRVRIACHRQGGAIAS